MDKGIKLYPHNLEGYNKVKEAYDKGEKVVGIVHATGTGKSYISLQLCLDNQDKKTLFVVPSNAIIEHIIETIGECGLSLEHDFPNLEFATYQSLTTKSDEELASMNIDMLVLDEFHHIGAPVWGEQVNKIVDSHPNMKVFGMTAYTVRDRNTSYERDMALPGGNELFSDKIVSTYDIYDAMCDGVLPIPNYKSAYLDLIKLVVEYEDEILDNKKLDYTKKVEYLNVLKSCKEQIDKAPKAKDLIKENLVSNDKCIYFCPVNDAVIVSDDEVLGTNDVQSIRNRIGHLALEVGGKTILYETTSDMGESGKLNREHFYNDTSFFRNEDVSNILRIMFAKNQYNEGVHAPGVTKVFMARQTNSDIVFFEQLGRALSVRGNIIELTKEYESKNIEELKYISNNQGIDISKCSSKEEIIERLLAPTIVDLVGNIEFIRELRDNLKIRIKERQEKGIYTKLTRVLVDTAFDITVDNEEIYQVLQDLHNRIHPFLTIEQAVDEIYALYEKTGVMPNTGSQERFTNGAQIGYWFDYKVNREKLIALANQGNEKAQTIVEKLKLNQEKIFFTIEKAVDEIYAIYRATGKMPNTYCRKKFSNGTVTGYFINNKKDEIIILANQGNEKAQTIVEKLKLNQEKIVLTTEQAVDEIYAIYEQTGKMPNTKCQEKISNGLLVGNWIRGNKEKILELANQGNEKAQTIVEKLKLNQEKKVLTTEQAVEEIYKIYELTGKMPNTISEEQFSNGTLIRYFIINNKDEIIDLANKGNGKAQTIVEKLKLNKILLTAEQGVEEIYEIYERTGVMPNTNSKEKFSNDITIGYFISNHKDEIIDLANQGNEKAQTIVEKLKLNQEKIFLTTEQAVEEIYEIYERTGKMPNTQCQEKFSNGTVTRYFIISNKDEIIDLANQGNEKAKIIVEKLKLNNEFLKQVVEEIYAIYESTGVIPKTTGKEKFSSGTLIGKWLSKKNNKEKIKELAQQGNEKAKKIVEQIKLNQEKIVLAAEQAVEEIYEIYESTGKMPNTYYREKFSNGIVIGIWLKQKKNQEKLIELASEGNEKAKVIYAFLSKKNDKDKYIELYNEYNIDYNKNKKYINKVSYTLLRGIIKYFIDNNIPYVDNNGILVSDIFMSSKDFEAKYGISIIELISNKKTR